MTEREWREASDMRQATVSVAAIVLAAALLRLFGIGGAAVYAAHPAEAVSIDAAIEMMRAGSLHPPTFEAPSLFPYVQLGTAIARFMSGAAAGEWRSLDGVSPSDFYSWGRAVTALLGTATVLLVYLIGLRWGTRPALLGAGLMAVVPLHVGQSQLALASVPLTFFVALTLLLSLRAHEVPRAGTFASAGAAAGLAAATDYAGLLALVLPLVAIWMTPATRPSRVSAALAAAAATLAAFLIAAPFTILDLRGFLNGFAAAVSRPGGGWGPAAAAAELLRNLEWPAFLLMIGGIVLAVVRAIRGPGRVRWTLALTFPVVFLTFAPRQGAATYGYTLPLLPFVCILSATAVVSGVSLLRRFSIPRALRTALIVGLTVVTLLPASLASIRLTRTVRTGGTAASAYAWMQAHVPPGAVVATEAGGLLLPGSRFRARHVRELREHSREEYLEAGVEYLVASSAAHGGYLREADRFPAEHAEYEELFRRTPEVARFSPAREGREPELRILQLRGADQRPGR